MLRWAHVYPERFDLRRDGPLWEPCACRPDTPDIEADDYGCAAVALVECDEIAAFGRAIDEFRGQCDQIDARMPWSARAGLLALGARVVRPRARPFPKDSVLAVWSH